MLSAKGGILPQLISSFTVAINDAIDDLSIEHWIENKGGWVSFNSYSSIFQSFSIY